MNRKAEAIGATLTASAFAFPAKRIMEPLRDKFINPPPPLRSGVGYASGGMRISTVIGRSGKAKQPAAATICWPSVPSPWVVGSRSRPGSPLPSGR